MSFTLLTIICFAGLRREVLLRTPLLQGSGRRPELLRPGANDALLQRVPVVAEALHAQLEHHALPEAGELGGCREDWRLPKQTLGSAPRRTGRGSAIRGLVHRGRLGGPAKLISGPNNNNNRDSTNTNMIECNTA